MSLDKKRGKGGKYKKSNHKEVSLSGDDLQYLIEHTSYDGLEIMVCFEPSSYNLAIIQCRGFIEDNPRGTLGREKMMKMYEAVLSVDKAKEFVDNIFNKFDADNSGEIDFKVYCVHDFLDAKF